MTADCTLFLIVQCEIYFSFLGKNGTSFLFSFIFQPKKGNLFFGSFYFTGEKIKPIFSRPVVILRNTMCMKRDLKQFCQHQASSVSKHQRSTVVLVSY